jgi:DNA polymerase I-like protein with 3'-5' exonuclease and polymerase domains
MSTKLFSAKTRKQDNPCSGCLETPNPIPFRGQGRKGILIYTEYKNQDEMNFISSIILGMGYNPMVDCFLVHAIQCEEAKKSKATITSCFNFKKESFEKLLPSVKRIFVFGKNAWISFSKLLPYHKALSGKFLDYENKQIYDQHIKKFISVLPSYVSYIEDKELRDNFRNRLIRELEGNFKDMLENIKIPINIELPKVELFMEEKDITVFLDIFSWKEIAFDYETNSLKPFREGSKILSVSFSNGERCLAFKWYDSYKNILIKLLTFDVTIIAHNSYFEMLWTLVKFDTWISNSLQDTMLIAYANHNKEKNSLKYLVYREFGYSYDDDIKEYMENIIDEDVHGDNAFNNLENAPLDKLLLYNGLDSYFTFMLYKYFPVQQEVRLGYDRLLKSSRVLVEMQRNGMCIDEKELNKHFLNMEKIQSSALKNIESDDCLKQWTGDIPFDFTKPTHLKKLFFTDLKLTPIHLTDKGFPSLDQEALGEIGLQIADSILEYRLWEKLKTTYLPDIKREIIKGKVHPNFNMTYVKSYRTSATAPNTQNMPSRNIEQMNMIKSLYLPREGHCFITGDYKAIEVGIAACYTQDPNLLKYVRDSKNTDMHRDMAMQIFKLEKDKVKKEWRHLAKNGFVFPAFYGAKVDSIAPNVWNRIDLELRQHLSSLGIESFKDFTSHIKDVFYDFWNNRFRVYTRWKEEQKQHYYSTGYVESETGFRYRSPMVSTEICNYPIQGSAAHCLLWTAERMMFEMRERGWKDDFLVNEIHDDLMGDILQEHIVEYLNLLWIVGTQEIKKAFPWITIPLEIEAGITLLNRPWNEKKDLGLLDGNMTKDKLNTCINTTLVI